MFARSLRTSLVAVSTKRWPMRCQRAHQFSDQSGRSFTVIESFNKFKPFAQSALVLIALGGFIFGAAGVMKDIQVKIAVLDEKISKVEATTEEKISKVEATTEEKIATVKAEAALEATNVYLKYNHDEQYVSLRKSSSTDSRSKGT